jgi:glycosyltransferase involved in cell wall biosynthesis
MSRIHLSGAMVVQNNETTIGPVLDSLSPHCDEVVVVDGGSTDQTPEIAAANPKVRLIRNEFKGNLSVQKNFAFDQCRGEWILMIDTDELLGGRRVGWLRRLTRVPGMSWYSIPRYWLVEKDGELHYLSERPYYRDRQLRLFKNLPGFRYHETEWPIHHRFIKKTGRGRPLRNPHIYHFALMLQDRETREGKQDWYLKAEPHSADLHRMYLWEDLDPSSKPIPRPIPGILTRY